MPQYWLDANVFIEANNSYFSLDLVPAFWIWLETNLKADVLCTSSMAYDEILGKDDGLAKWAKVRREFAHTGRSQTATCRTRTGRSWLTWEISTEPQTPTVGNFLAKADCWIIAHAKAKGGKVVHRESKVDKLLRLPRCPTCAKSSTCRSLRRRRCSEH